MKSPTWTIGIGFTAACNMRCRFCYSQDQRCVDSLPLEFWLSFVRRNASEIKAINYGTGENTLNRAWYRLVEFVRAHAPVIRQALTTNGYLVEAVKDGENSRIIDTCIDEIDVSIDFASSDLHDRRRGYPGAFDLALRTLAYCADHEKRPTIVMMGEEESLHLFNLERLFDLAARYGALVRLNLYRHVSSGSPFESPSPRTVVKALDWIIEHHTVVSVSEPVFSSIYGIQAAPGMNKLLSMRILPNGDITPSTYLISNEWIAGNVREGRSLDEVAQAAQFRRFIQPLLPEACRGCPHEDSCGGGTHDRRFLTWGSLERPDVYCPRVAACDSQQNPRPRARLQPHEATVHSAYLPTMVFAPGQNGNAHVTT